MSYPPQHGPYPQQGPYPLGGYPPQGQPPYGQYPPPRPLKKKSKAGRWIAVVAVVVVLGGAFAFTGWVTPGFFKKKLDTTSRATPEQLAQSFANAITEHAMFDQLWCKIRSKRSYTAEQIFEAARDEAKLTNPVHPTGQQERAATVTAGPISYGFAMVPGNQGWCVRDAKQGAEPEPLAITSTDPKPRPQVKDGADAANQFIAAVNGRDIPTALSVMCQNAPDTTRSGTQQLINGEVKLVAQATDVLRTAGRTIVHLTTNVDGVAGQGRVETDDGAKGGPCVTSFDPSSD